MNVSTSEVLAMCGLLITIVATLIAFILTMEQVRKNRYTRYNTINKANLDEHRSYYEEMIHKLQIELSENERRWKDINHLIINGQTNKEIRTDQAAGTLFTTSGFFRNLGIDIDQIKVEKKSIFVLTPFSDIETKTFDAIKKVCGEVDLKCSRGDEVYRENNILSHIVESILKSNVIIANINGRNPNVFYELGICHALGKPVIVISKTKNDLPFDISAKNIVFYEDEEDLQGQLKSELLKIFIDTTTEND